MEAQIRATDIYQGLAWAFVLNYLIPTLPGKFQRTIYLWRLRNRQLMSTKVWPGPLCWTTWFLLCPVSFREQYASGGSDTGNRCLSSQGLAWAFVLNYLVPTLPGKFQRTVYLWRLRYRQQMSTKVWPGPLCWTTWFLLCLVSFRLNSIPMEAQIPTTDVYQGLAWAFVLNYLVPTLPGKFCLFCFEVFGPVNTIKVMSSRSVNQSTLFILSLVTDNCPT